MSNCEHCGTTITFGDWPFCPHGPTPKASTAPFVAYVDEHVSADGNPRLISNPGDRRQAMRENQCDYRAKGVGMPGCEV